jgi:hypothetical protein
MGYFKRTKREDRNVEKIPATEREFWADRIKKALDLMTDAELGNMANQFSEIPGSVFTLTIIHQEDSRQCVSRAVVTTEMTPESLKAWTAKK